MDSADGDRGGRQAPTKTSQQLKGAQLFPGGGRSALGRKLNTGEMRELISHLQQCRVIMMRALQGPNVKDDAFRPLWQMAEICAKSTRRSDCNPESL